MRDELERFVASLAIPADRKAIVLAELADHVACATEAAARAGLDAEAAGRAALGNLDALRRSLEAIEPAFRITRCHAAGRGLIAALAVAIAIDQGGAMMSGAIGALVALAIVAVLAPPRALDLLRAELRSPQIRAAIGLGRGVPIGPGLTYAAVVTAVPFLVWTGLIFQRAYAGGIDVTFETPLSAFAVAVAVTALLLVESLRVRRKQAAA